MFAVAGSLRMYEHPVRFLIHVLHFQLRVRQGIACIMTRLDEFAQPVRYMKT